MLARFEKQKTTEREAKIAAEKVAEGRRVAKSQGKVRVTRIQIAGKHYLKSSINILYDPNTKEEVGIWDPESKIIKELPDEESDEEEEEEEECEDVLRTMGINDEELRLQFAMLARFEKQKKTENETNSKDLEASFKKSVATTQAPTAAPANISVTRLQVEGKLYLIL